MKESPLFFWNPFCRNVKDSEVVDPPDGAQNIIYFLEGYLISNYQSDICVVE